MTTATSTESGGAIPPGGTIGILGGGQLGRMTAMAAARLGYRVHVFTPEGAGGPCAQVCAAETVAAYDDLKALAAFADAVDVVTLEFENVPLATAEFLAARRPFFPAPACLAVTQVRTAEKAEVNKLGFATAPWLAVTSLEELNQALGEVGRPAVLKTNRFGYDGKGQAKIGPDGDAAAIWASLKTDDAILEGFVDFVREISIVLARGRDGAIAAYPAVENRHRDHILSETIVPAAIRPAVAAEAERMAAAIATDMGYVGVLAVEMFETRDGRLLVNELAPRPHNSGHWTIEGAATSQFEQLVRAVCGLPLGSVEYRPSRMINLIGDDALDWQSYLTDPAAHLHLYGKPDIRPGRKMGHVTWVKHARHSRGRAGYNLSKRRAR
jgi:5-(carboxyamino)imidazole ribonucleotide synthase